MMRQLLLVPPFVLTAIFILKSIAALRGFNWDIDIDHMMYFGSRIWHGELVWTKEFDEQMPIIQLVFAIPALLKSIRTWQFISLVLIMTAAFFLWMSLKLVLTTTWGVRKKSADVIALYFYPVR